MKSEKHRIAKTAIDCSSKTSVYVFKNDDIRLWPGELMIHLTFIVHADYHSPLIPCWRSAGHLYCLHLYCWKHPANCFLAPSSFVLPQTISFATYKRMSSVFAWGANQLLGGSGPVMINVCRALTCSHFLLLCLF